MAVVRGSSPRTVTITASGAAGTIKELRVRPHPGRVRLFVWNNSAYKVRFSVGHEPTSTVGGLIFQFGGDEFAQNQDEIIFVPDSSAGANLIELTVYEEFGP